MATESRSSDEEIFGSSRFAPVMRVTGSDGGLGLLGDYQVTPELIDGFPKYEKVGVDTSKTNRRRFLSRMAYDGGRWVFSEWKGVLLFGPLAPKSGQSSSPDQYVGNYTPCGPRVERRCSGPVNIIVTKLDSTELITRVTEPTSDEEEGAAEVSEDEDGVYIDRHGIMRCSEHRQQWCPFCCVDYRGGNNIIRRGKLRDQKKLNKANHKGTQPGASNNGGQMEQR